MFPKALKWSKLGCIFYLILCLITVASSSTSSTPLLLPLSNCTVAGTNVDSWGLGLDLADPLQYLCVVPSTVVNSTLVISSNFCQTESNITNAQCESLCGNTFNTSSAGSSYTSSSASAVLAPNPVWADLSPEALLAGTTELQLPNKELSKYPIGIITSGDHQNVGHFGLANDSDFLNYAVCDGLIPANGFGLNAGSQSVANPRDGSLVLGGYDLASVGGAFYNFSVATVGSSERECPLQVTITLMVLRFPLADGFTDVTLTSSGVLIPACIEPYDNLFRLPQTVLEAFQEATDWSADTTADPNLYVVEPGLYYPQTKGFNGSLIITLSNGFEVEIPNHELSNPLRGIDANGARVLQPNITEVNIFSEDAPLNTATLGKVYLSQAYLAVDYTINQFRLANIVSGNPAYLAPLTPATCSRSNTGNSSWAAKHPGDTAGIVIGVLALFCIICGFVVFLRWKASRRRREMLVQEQPQQMAGPQQGEELDDLGLPRPSSDSLRHSAHARDGQVHDSGSTLREVST